MQLTKNFSLYEFYCKDKNHTPVPMEYIGNVQKLANNLQILRAHLSDKLKQKGIPGEARIHVNSGYRTVEYNKSVRGKKNSKHLTASAGDITSKYFTPIEIAAAIEELITAKLMVQGGLGLYPGFVHYDIRGCRDRW